jgi:hypothetical protein
VSDWLTELSHVALKGSPDGAVMANAVAVGAS